VSVNSLGYLEWRTPEDEQWRHFATDILGMMASSGPGDSCSYFRIDDRPFRLIVSHSEAPQVVIGFEVRDDVELAALARRLEDAGVKVASGSEAEAEDRLVSGLISFEDPGGTALEAYYGPVLDHVPLQTPLVSGFVTGNMGMGHVVISVPEMGPALDFYRNGLGFFTRNDMKMPMGPDRSMTISFLGCNPRHHTLGLVDVPFPGGLVHFMLEAQTLDDVGRALDRVLDAQIPLLQSLGRHTNDHMVSFYCSGPDGAMVEVGWGAVQVPEPTTTYRITKGAFWGHRPPG
jgi:3,4-dihydroxy-9,10-secoandrosta-1,3,5(10)-triene-9,17-dione 4,5-dioxygenase